MNNNLNLPLRLLRLLRNLKLVLLAKATSYSSGLQDYLNVCLQSSGILMVTTTPNGPSPATVEAATMYM